MFIEPWCSKIDFPVCWQTVTHHFQYDNQFTSVAQSCPTLCNPMDCSTPSLPVHHQLLEFTQLMFIESLIPSNHLIFFCPLLLPSSIFPSNMVFSNEPVLHIRWAKYWSFSFTISPSKNTQDWSPLGWTGWISLQSKWLSRVLQLHSSKASILWFLDFFIV